MDVIPAKKVRVKQICKPEDYVHDHSLPKFEQERAVLMWFKDNFTTNPKKLKALARRLAPRVPEYIAKSLCLEIQKFPEPDEIKHIAKINKQRKRPGPDMTCVQWMERNFREIDEFEEIIENFVKDGFHGMIYDHEKLYPIKLKAMPKWLTEADGKWTEDDEGDILRKALKEWMIENQRYHHKDRVLLFERFGFSGMSSLLEYTLTHEEAEESKRRYRERKEQETNEELKRLMAL